MDLAPSSFVDGGATVLRGARQSADTAKKAAVRQSVPTRDRAETYRFDEMFQNTRVAMPLLVADFEVSVVSVARPMSGRSVGAAPAAAWTRSILLPAGANAHSTHSSTPSAWNGNGHR